MPASLYTEQKDVLSNATIGQHFRHIIEFYLSLKKGSKARRVSYDDRERNVLLETQAAYAITFIDKTIGFVSNIEDDIAIVLEGNYSNDEEKSSFLQSSLFRKLAYSLDHTVHHLAIIKIALKEESSRFEADENFGVAPSTVRFRQRKIVIR